MATIRSAALPSQSSRSASSIRPFAFAKARASILGGIQNKEDENNWSGIPGLSAIPVLKYIFGSRDRIIQDDDIVFVVVPHIVRSQELDQANLRIIDTGEGQSIDLRHAGQGDAASASVPPTPTTQPVANARLARRHRSRAERCRSCPRNARAVTL
ncbi:MAG: hypothetical protein WDM87_05620 [Terracidiphilus sp.]